jgi:uncharacterized protein
MGKQWLGPDFVAALAGKLYDARSGQGWLWALVFTLLMIGVHLVLQLLGAVLAHVWLFQSAPDFTGTNTAAAATLAKAALVSMLPVSIIMAAIVWWMAGLANSTGDRGIPLHRVRLGVLGWPVTVGGAMFVIWLCFLLTFWVLGIDPESYMPTKDGINDLKSSSGLVEKTMADLADEPFLFALALPGIIIGAPLAEELMFRGALFAAIRRSWAGQTGAVVLSAAAWAFIHGASAPWLFVFVIFLMGLLLGLLLLRFGSLWVTIAVHAAWNAFSTLAIVGGVSGP